MSRPLTLLVERIIRDPVFRKAFLAQPEAILDEHAISDSERRALVRAQRRLLAVGPGQGIALTQIEWP
jgi:hypothetical protein